MMDLAPWHPVVVHFPVALIITAAALDLAAAALKRPSLREGALWCLGIGLTGAVTAAFIAHALLDAGADKATRATLERHETLAYLTVGVATLALTTRVLAWWRGCSGRVMRVLETALLVGAALCVGATGLFGGRLTHGGASASEGDGSHDHSGHHH